MSNEHALGCKLEPRNHNDYPYELVAGSSDEELPKSFVIQDVPRFYQNGKDCCVASAIGAPKSMQEGKRVSQRHIWHHGKKREEYFGYGTYFSYCMSGMTKEGVVNEGTIDENIHMDRDKYMRVTLDEMQKKEARKNRADSYWFVAYGAENIEALKRALVTEKIPLVTSMRWYKEYNNPVNGFLPKGKSATPEGHMYILKGYIDENGRDKLVFQNSWGENWGDGGDFYIWADELADYNMYSFYAILDIPKDKGHIITNYREKLIRNEDHPAHYYVGKDGKIAWIEDEPTFHFGTANGWWGKWEDTITVDAPLQDLYDLIF